MASTPPLDFQKTVRELQLKFTRFYAQALSKQRLSFSQFALVSFIYHGGDAAMNVLAKHLMVSLPAVTYLGDRLERDGVVRRPSHGHDRRITLIRITEKGNRAVEETQVKIQKLFVKTLLAFGPRERSVIQKFYVDFSHQLETQLAQTVIPVRRNVFKRNP